MQLFKRPLLLIVLAASLLGITVTGSFVLSVPATAAPLDDVCSAGATSDSPVCREKNKTGDPITGPNGILTRVIQILVFIIGIAAVIMIIINGLRYIISNGDSGAVNSAKNGIIYALIGLVVAILAQAIVSFVLNRL